MRGSLFVIFLKSPFCGAKSPIGGPALQGTALVGKVAPPVFQVTVGIEPVSETNRMAPPALLQFCTVYIVVVGEPMGS